ncbi:P-aminobenzoate N-oxygenase AurF [Mycolicibacterium aurum]|uniref:p-aminobenzoate N-oxygenase AurF n=2 Tax=Mycolicibacterium aurum TaxID=1791 RepID=A0A3S4S8A5_MYCAU|nr:P-aminobenzoate N-oxygenase AurF [Mycolicibacterium aurum]
MGDMTTTSAAAVGGRSRDDISLRLLKGSAKKSYEPVVDLDWDAPLADDKHFLPPQMSSLYGTPMWEQMSAQQRIDLSRHEFANYLSMGIWFENMLNQSLLRGMMHSSPTSNDTFYELTELGDEARHMLMFGKAIQRAGVEPFWPTGLDARRVNAMPFIFRGPMLWIAALVGEEIFDALQRRILDDGDDVQPLVQRVMRIHVTEEARHIQFARDGIRRDIPALSRRTRWLLANLHGLGARLYFQNFTRRGLYHRVGLDSAEAQRQARANPNFHAVQREGFASLAAFLDEAGLMGPIARRMWKRNHFL